LFPALLVPSEVYIFIFGDEFGETKTVLWMMSAGILVFSINLILANHFAGTGRYWVNTTASLIGLAINIPANLLLIPEYGLAGAGIAASLTFFAITLYTWIKFVKESSLHWKDLVMKKEDVRKLLALTGWNQE
jgi:O-antigen/teichoic acid export membrane protein